MARGVNKVIIIGNLGQDPESKYMDSGAVVVNFSIAATESWKDRQSGEMQERTEWVRVEVWGKQAEACAQYLTKGSQVYVEGKLRTEKWQDRGGNDRYTTKVRADQVQFLGSPRQGHAPSAPSSQAKPQGEPQPDFEDDIPF